MLKDMPCLGQWSAFFRRSNEAEFNETSDPIFKRALKFEEEFMTNDDFMQIYRDREETDRISAYANGRHDGLTEGLEQGLKKGKDEAHCEMAKSLLKDNMPLDFNCRHTGLSMDKVAALRDVAD